MGVRDQGQYPHTFLSNPSATVHHPNTLFRANTVLFSLSKCFFFIFMFKLYLLLNYVYYIKLLLIIVIIIVIVCAHMFLWREEDSFQESVSFLFPL